MTAVARRALVVSASVFALGAAAPATTRAATAQVIAAGDVGADVAVRDDGRASLVSPAARPDRRRLPSVRVRSATPGARFGRPRTLMRSGRADRAVAAGVAADGSGVIAVQSIRGTRRRVRALPFGPRGTQGRAVVVSRGDASDFAALDVAPSGAAVVVWFRHNRNGRWRLEAAVREPGAAAFGPARPVAAFVRRPCCTSVSAAIGERGDAVVTWSSTARPAVRAALRSPGRAFRAPQILATDPADEPRAVVGADGTAAIVYSAQHVPLRATDGLQLHRAVRGRPFGRAERVNPGGGVTTGEATVTRTGRVMVAWVDRPGARVRVSEAAPGTPLVDAGTLGTNASADRIAVAAEDDGRAIVAWSQRVSTRPASRERAVAAVRPAAGAPFGPAVALGRPWRAAEPQIARLVPGGGALVVWKGSRLPAPVGRRVALSVTRLP